MAINYISRFGENTKTNYESGYGTRYSDADWSDDNTLQRTAGLLPQTGISSKVLNTVLNQTTFVSYIVGQVLVRNILVDQLGQNLITNIIGPDTQDIESNIIKPFRQFLDRLNMISGYVTNSASEKPGSEITWRTRQLGDYASGDTPMIGICYWYIDTDNGMLKYGGNTNNYTNRGIRCNFLGDTESHSKYISFTGDGYTVLQLHQTTKLSTISVQNTDDTPNSTTTISGNVSIDCNPDGPSAMSISEKSTYAITLKGNPVNLTGIKINLKTTDSYRPDIRLYSYYDNAGTTYTNNYKQQSVENILYDIDKRLDAYGF